MTGPVKNGLDAAAVGGGLTAWTLPDLLSMAVAVLSIVWLLIRIGDWVCGKMRKSDPPPD